MKCKHYENNIILLLYNELGETERDKLKVHLENCDSCRTFLEENKKMFSELSESVPDEFDPAWDQYWTDISRNIKRSEKKQWFPFPIPSGAAAYALSVLILVGGIFIGRFFMPSSDTSSPNIKNRTNLLYVNNYFEDVKPVMLDYANYTIHAANGNGGPVDMEIIKKMLGKTRLLKRHVSAEKNPYLATLLEELELILTEIKNTTSDEKDSMQTLQEMIKERNIPLKIDLFKNKANRSERI